MKLWNSDEELFALAKHELFTAVVGDVMDKMGLLHQFLPPRLQPLRDDMVAIGRAMPVLEADVFDVTGAAGANPLMAQPFGLMLRALDDLKADLGWAVIEQDALVNNAILKRQDIERPFRRESWRRGLCRAQTTNEKDEGPD